MRQLLVGSLCVAGFGCSRSDSAAVPSDRKAAIRREVLRGNDLTETRRRAEAEARTTDDTGALIPSNVTRAGITLPRGYDAKFVFDHEWHYDGHLPLSKLEAYFRAQLNAANIQRSDDGTVLFAHATAKDSLHQQPVTVTILPIPNRDPWNRIRIVAPPPPPQQNLDQIRAELSVGRHSRE